MQYDKCKLPGILWNNYNLLSLHTNYKIKALYHTRNWRCLLDNNTNETMPKNRNIIWELKINGFILLHNIMYKTQTCDHFWKLFMTKTVLKIIPFWFWKKRNKLTHSLSFHISWFDQKTHRTSLLSTCNNIQSTPLSLKSFMLN
jgi:hypothetical protein